MQRSKVVDCISLPPDVKFARITSHTEFSAARERHWLVHGGSLFGSAPFLLLNVRLSFLPSAYTTRPYLCSSWSAQARFPRESTICNEMLLDQGSYRLSPRAPPISASTISIGLTTSISWHVGRRVAAGYQSTHQSTQYLSVAQSVGLSPLFPPPRLDHTMSTPCYIAANPDISGIGVRISIYAQTLLAFGPSIFALRNRFVGKTQEEETITDLAVLELTADLAKANQVLGLAMLLSFFVQAFSPIGLSSYHASIVLSMSWLTNSGAFVYFLLLVQYKNSEKGPKRVKPYFFAWIAYISRLAIKPMEDFQAHIEARITEIEGSESEPSKKKKLPIREYSDHLVVPYVATLHLTLMSAFGIWLWRSPGTFGKMTSASACAVQFAELTILGQPVPFGSTALRKVSLAIYSIFVVGPYNFVVPALLFLSLCRVCTKKVVPTDNPSTPASAGADPKLIDTAAIADNTVPGTPDPKIAAIVADTTSTTTIAVSTATTAITSTPVTLETPPSWAKAFRQALNGLKQGASRVATTRSFPTWVGMGIILVVDLVFIVDIELTLRRNQALQTTGDEKQWGFGQVLAMVLLIMPMVDLFNRMHPFEQIRRYHRDLQSDFRDNALRHAVEHEDEESVRRWLDAGADSNADIDAKDGAEAGFLLHAACRRQSGRSEIVKLLLENRADPDVKDGAGIWLLRTASVDLDVVRILLEYGAWPNVRDSERKTLLHIACSTGQLELVRLLLDNGSSPRTLDREWKTPLHDACSHSEVKRELIEILFEHRASAGETDREERTALHIACSNKGITPDVIQLLLEHGARPDAQDNDGRTPQALAEETHGPSSEIVRTLLRQGVSAMGAEEKV
ncbi:hypothetical protein NMY22_g1682 [Coprinellus aureogranulatus]|nr:hypothetical protein NMY22_g1682 [Coprinellus aureogranulatus]